MKTKDSSLINLQSHRKRKLDIQEGTIINKRIVDDSNNTIPFAGWLVDIELNSNSFLYDVPYFGGTINVDTEDYSDFVGSYNSPKVKSKVLIVWESGMPFSPYVIQSYPFPWRVPRGADAAVDGNYSAEYFKKLFTRLKDDGELEDNFISNKTGNRVSIKENGDVELSVKSKDSGDAENPVFKKSLITIERETGNINLETGKVFDDNETIVNEIKIINEVDAVGLNIVINKSNENNEITINVDGETGKVLIQRSGDSANGEIISLEENLIKAKLNDNVKMELDSTTGSEKIIAQTSSNYKVEIDEAAGKVKVNGGTDLQAAARKGDAVESTIVEDSTYWTWILTLFTIFNAHTHATAAPGAPSPPITPLVTYPTSLKSKITEGSSSVNIGGMPN